MESSRERGEERGVSISAPDGAPGWPRFRHRRVGRFGLAACALLELACGNAPDAGKLTGDALPASVVAARAERQSEVLDRAGASKSILFGDLHVHSTFSFDAFVASLPILQGEGVHPVADACDFARYCSDLDFFSINDHAEASSPRIWNETQDMIRQCNEVAGDPADPDLVAYVGWEWTHMGRTPEGHYGHKNVILRELAADRLPTRPIAAPAADAFSDVSWGGEVPVWALGLPLQDFANRERYFDLWALLFEIGKGHIPCPTGVDTRELPPDCHEQAAEPRDLFEKLNQWGFDSMVIPHGTAWGWYTPPGASLDKQLEPGQNDPNRQRLIEVYSGHGNSEEYRSWSAAELASEGEGEGEGENGPICPEPTPDYLPCCWRAGELIEARCQDPASDECQDRVEAARANHIALGPAGHQAVSGEEVEDWLDCGVCRDCFLPAFNYRPRESAQYALAISNFDEVTESSPEPGRFRFGFIASSDNHDARPGTGYKEYGRTDMTEARGPRDWEWYERLYSHRGDVKPESIPRSEVRIDHPMFNYLNPERGASFFMTGGLVAVHSEARDRDSIWNALMRREVYGTSGPRILLHFDLLNGPQGQPLPMGSQSEFSGTPRFRVRASGSFAQQPGCPDASPSGISAERLSHLCKGECYNPSDRRLRIERIEIVRIRPQIRPDEPVETLIEDPWLVRACPGDPFGCSFEFDDPDFVPGGREVAYYARAIQEPTPAVNGAGLRCDYDDEGACISVSPCYADPRTDVTDDCLSDVEERAWASPIFLRPTQSQGVR